MKVIIGLGNPGPKYQITRHNVGFMVIDALVKKLKLKFRTSTKSKAVYAWASDDLELVKPQTYMNRSGTTVASILKKHNLTPQDMIVVSDDLDLALGKIRQRNSGSSGGHNGLQSIIEHLGTDQFARIKIGIGRPKGDIDPSRYVLQPFTKTELSEIQPALKKVVDLLLEEM